MKQTKQKYHSKQI